MGIYLTEQKKNAFWNVRTNAMFGDIFVRCVSKVLRVSVDMLLVYQYNGDCVSVDMFLDVSIQH